MFKMIAMYKQPDEADLAPFEEYYFSKHMPLVGKMPGLVRAEVGRVVAMPGSEPPYYMLTEMYFNSQAEMQQALSTPEGRAVVKDTRNFPPGLLSMAYAEVIEPAQGEQASL